MLSAIDKGNECEPDLRIILGRFRVGAVGSQLQSGLRNLKRKKSTKVFCQRVAILGEQAKIHYFTIISIAYVHCTYGRIKSKNFLTMTNGKKLHIFSRSFCASRRYLLL
jgi:hypothetical protein